MKNRKLTIQTLLATVLCVAVLGIAALISKPVQADTRAVTKTSYGTVNRSTAPQGHITFTASGQGSCFILQGPDNGQAFFSAQKGETIEIPLADGAGKYQYAIANVGSDGKTYSIQYKDSFTVSEIDVGLSARPVSAPCGG